MPEAKTFNLAFFSKGINLKNTADTIQIEEYANSLNLMSDREGAIRTRYGRTRLNTAAIFASTNVHTLARLKGTAAAYRYAGTGTQLNRAATPFTTYSEIRPGVTWAPSTAYAVDDLILPITSNRSFYICTVAGTSGTIEPSWPVATAATVADNTVTWKESNITNAAMLACDYAIGIDTNPWMLFANSTIFLKDYGTGNPSLMGIVPPPVVVGRTVDAEKTKDIQTFENYLDWTETDPSAVLTLSNEATIKRVGTNSLKCAFSAKGDAHITQNKTLDLTVFGADASTDDDYIHIYMYSSAPQNISEILLQLSIGDTAFTQLYEKSLAPSAMQPGVNFTSKTHTATVPDATQTALYDDPPSDSPLVQFVAAPMEPGANVWTEFAVRKKDFLPVTWTDTSFTWLDVKSLRIKFKVIGAVDVYLDDWTLIGGGNLKGDDYRWYQIYRDGVTGELSDPSTVSTAFATAAGPARQSVTLTLRYSKNPRVTFIDIYRSGGTATDALFVAAVANSSSATGASTVTYVDNIADASLGSDALKTDNDRPPNFPYIEIWNETCWGWGYSSDAPNKIRFSKKIYVGAWPVTYYIFAGTGGDKVVRVIAQDVNLFIFTLAEVYQVVGSDNTTYQAIKTGYGRGMIDNPFAIIAAVGRIFHVYYDGVYEFPSGKKISEPIDGVFHSQTINGISPINASSLSTVRMAFYDNKVFIYYASGVATANNAAMVYDTLYDRWTPSDVPAISAIFEKDTSLLVIGESNGYIDQAEVGTADNGTAISFDLRTKYIDLGFPDQDKQWLDLMLDIDTGGQSVTAQMLFNNGGTTDTAQTVSTASRAQVHLKVNSGDSLVGLNAQLKITGSVTAQVTIYKAALRIYLEPPRRRNFVTDWDDSGTPLRKIYRTITLELDTLGGGGVIPELQVDNAVAKTFTTVKTTGRKVVYLGIPEDIKGVLSRLKFTQVTDAITSECKLYRHSIDVLPQPYNPETWQTEWTDKGYPYDKYWKEVLLEIDTAGGNRTVSLQVDNVTVQTFTVNTASRLRVTQSVTRDIIGKLARMVITGGETALYSHDYVVDRDPPDVTIADSLEQNFGIYRFKQLKRLWLAYKAPSVVTIKVYCDEVLRSTKTAPASSLTSGWVKTPITLDPCKGIQIRVVLTSASRFKAYWEQTQMEARPVGSDRSYVKYQFSPPQLM